MTNKALSLTIGIFTTVSLLLLSCSPRAATPTPTTPAPTPGAVTPAPAPVTPAPTPAAAPTAMEKPKYGGTLNVVMPNFLDKFDIAVSPG